MRGTVIRPDGALREVAPVVTRGDEFTLFVREGFVGVRSGEHLFCAEMAATGFVHTSPFSLSSVRRMSALAIGTL